MTTSCNHLTWLHFGLNANYVAFVVGLTLEEIAAKFGDKVAVDISHLSEDRRRALDESLMAVGADGITETPPNDEKTEASFTEKA